MGDLVQSEYPKNQGGTGVGQEYTKSEKISETVQDRTKITITD